MKKIILLISLVFLLSISTTIASENDNSESNSNENPSALFIRGGASDITGFVAGEYFHNNMGFSLGWHSYAPSIANETASSVDIGLFFYDAPYYENSWYLGIGFASNNAVHTTNGNVDSFYPTWAFVGGYRFGGELLDLKLGAGYLTSKIMNGVAIDLTLGITFN